MAFMAKVYSYTRWSTPEQAKGDSFRRQSELAEKWAAERGLEIDRTLNLRDSGVSAYRGSNLDEDQGLGSFLFACKNGLIEPNSVLLVESLDRLSRMTPRKAVRLLEDILETGVSVYTLNDNQHYTIERFDTDALTFMVSYMSAYRAHEESRVKAQRVAAAWQAKRERLAAGSKELYTLRAPGWLRYNGEQWEPIPERANVVRRIFDLTQKGWGEHRIALTLNQEGVPPFGRAKHWHRSSVAKLLRNPSVIGQVVPGRRIVVDGIIRRETFAAVDGAFPPVIPAETWAAVQEQKRTGSMPRGRHGRTAVTFSLAGLARCPLCQGAMTRVAKGPRSLPKLVCAQAKVGAGCTYRSVSVQQVEDALQDRLWLILNDPPSGTRAPTADRALEVLRMELRGYEEFIDELAEKMARNPTPAIARQLAEARVQVAALRQRETELEQDRDAADGGLVAVRSANLRAALEPAEDEPIDVPTLNAALRSLFTGVTVDWREGVLVLEWKQGGEPGVIRYGLPEGEAA